MSRFRATTQGVEATLLGPEIAILARLGGLLDSAGVKKGDPATDRLMPDIYPRDGQSSRDFHRLVGKERMAARSADREVFGRGLEAAMTGTTLLTADDAAAWARVIGEARIVLAARKGLFDSGLPDGKVDDPEVALVMFLGVVQEELVSEMLLTMEEPK
jgi:hypothetical protein